MIIDLSALGLIMQMVMCILVGRVQRTGCPDMSVIVRQPEVISGVKVANVSEVFFSAV